MTVNWVSTELVDTGQPAPIRRLQVLVPWLAAAGAALLAAIGLNRLWDLDKAMWWALGGVVVGGLGICIAIVLITRAYAAPDPSLSALKGQTAKEARWILNHRPLENIGDINQLDETIGKLGTSTDADSVTPVELDRARRALRERIGQHLKAADPAQENQYRDAVNPLRQVLADWDKEEEKDRDATRRQKSVAASRWGIAGLAIAVVLVLVGLWLLMTAVKEDAEAELTSAVDQRREILDEERTSSLRQRAETLALEQGSAQAAYEDKALPIKDRTKVDAILSARDIQDLNALRSGCEPLKGVVVTAIAIGGTWERPILNVVGGNRCADVSFHPQDPAPAKPAPTSKP
jgi:hypothetical protein